MGKELELRFDPRTIEHLGVKMYSRVPHALAELVANAYDANATSIDIKLYDENEKRITVKDNGDGMSFDEINDKFLIIGRKRRDDDEQRENYCGRKITGKKGLGKLALFGIGKTITIKTTKKGDKNWICFVLDWDEIISSDLKYNPSYSYEEKEDNSSSGTEISLDNLSRKTEFDLEEIAVSLSKMFNFYDTDCRVTVFRNDNSQIELDRELRYKDVEVEMEWDIHDICDEISSEYEYKNQLFGKIISSPKPMRPDLRGITLYANGRLVNSPGYFGKSEAGYTYSYISGWIDADFLDEFPEDLISTDRQSINWEISEASDLQEFLHKILGYLVRDWSEKRKELKVKRIKERSGIDSEDWVERVPSEMQENLKSVLTTLVDEKSLESTQFSGVVEKLHDLIPPYTYYHYRMLHSEIQNASREKYESGDYYFAFTESIKRYINAVKKVSGNQGKNGDSSLMSEVFGPEKPLKVSSKYKRPNGEDFDPTTLCDIENGQHFLSKGVVQGGRNVISHEEAIFLKESGLFTEKDCLDMLSILSHLYRRLDDAIIETKQEESKAK